MLERLILVGILALVSVIAYRMWTARQLRRISAQSGNSTPADPILQDVRAGVPVVVYFTTPTCAVCKTQQQPALERLFDELGGALEIIRIDATQQPDVADRWGVFSAPTTFVIGVDRVARAVNHGVASAGKLRQQIGA